MLKWCRPKKKMIKGDENWVISDKNYSNQTCLTWFRPYAPTLEKNYVEP